MFKKFHVDYLAKAWAMRVLAEEAELIKEGWSIQLSGEDIERFPDKRRAVVLGLVGGGYLTTGGLGDKLYGVTDKAFQGVMSEVPDDCNWLAGGEEFIGSPSRPLAMQLRLWEICEILVGLQAGKVEFVEDDGEGEVFVATVLTTDDLVLSNWEMLCEKLLGMGELGSKMIPVPGRDFSPDFLLEAVTQRELAWAKIEREVYTIKAAAGKIRAFGGWDAFLVKCREAVVGMENSHE